MLIVPQWQGSGTPAPHRLVAGAHRLGALLPADRRTVVPIDAQPDPKPDPEPKNPTPDPRRTHTGVLRLDALARSLAATEHALAAWGDDALFTVGGDCGVELAPIAHAAARHGERLAVVWFDAHPDLNTPESSPSGGFHGMVLRTLLGDGPDDLLPAPERRPSANRLVLAGVRAVDPAEERFIEARGIRRVSVDALRTPNALVAAVAATGATHVYIHVDLDVLDPARFGALSFPEPDGLRPDRLRAALRALTEAFALAGLGITEHAPGPAAALADPTRDDDTLREIFADVCPG